MRDISGSQRKFGRPWWGVATVGLFALALASGCGGAASGTPSTATDTVSAPHNADNGNDGVGDKDGNVLTIRPVSSSGPSNQGQVDCSASATHGGVADEPLVVCDADGNEAFHLERAIITDDGVVSAQSHEDPQTGSFMVMLEFTPGAERELRAFTSAHEGTALAFVVDGTVLFAPVIRDAIQGKVMISGDFSEAEASDLADRLS